MIVSRHLHHPIKLVNLHCLLMFRNKENYERITSMAFHTLLWSTWPVACWPISLCFFVVSFLQGVWNTLQLFIFITFLGCSNGQEYLSCFSFYRTQVRKELAKWHSSLRSVGNHDFYAQSTKLGVHIFLMALIWANGVFSAIVEYVSLWTETAKARDQQTSYKNASWWISQTVQAIRFPLQLLNNPAVARRQPEAMCKWMSVLLVFQ